MATVARETLASAVKRSQESAMRFLRFDTEAWTALVAERHDWIRALLIGEELRSRDDDVLRVERIAHTLAPEEVKRCATEHKFYEGLDRLRKDLDEIARTDFRQIAGGRCDRQ